MGDITLKKLIPIVAVIVIVLMSGVIFLFFFQKETGEQPVEQIEENKGVVETAKDISESVPEIETNAGAKVPEVNPIDRANPYKYTNPLR